MCALSLNERSIAAVVPVAEGDEEGDGEVDKEGEAGFRSWTADDLWSRHGVVIWHYGDARM